MTRRLPLRGFDSVMVAPPNLAVDQVDRLRALYGHAPPGAPQYPVVDDLAAPLLPEASDEA